MTGKCRSCIHRLPRGKYLERWGTDKYLKDFCFLNNLTCEQMNYGTGCEDFDLDTVIPMKGCDYFCRFGTQTKGGKNSIHHSCHKKGITEDEFMRSDYNCKHYRITDKKKIKARLRALLKI